MNSFKVTTLSLAAAAAIALSGCGGSSSSTSTTTPAANCDSNYIDVVLDATISSDTTLDATKVYGLDGKVKVTDDSILTIPAGTKIAGCTPQSFMVVSAGSQLIANGTQAEPIVFTSQKDIKGESEANSAGEWGGLVLAGNAYTHYGVKQYEADETVSYGSADHANDTDSSGSL
ncbi:hypothetical protein KJ691_02500, partial [bacterium]|nr:hypothetical protein [bacterium]